MKKTLTAFAVIGMIAAVPAFAGERHTQTQKTTYTEQTVYHTVKVPLTPEQVAERQRMGTKIEQTINRFDTNGDRELNRAEYGYSSHLFNIDDSNKASAFYNIDTNHDGQLSSQELLKAELAEKERTVAPVAVETHTTDEHVIRHVTR